MVICSAHAFLIHYNIIEHEHQGTKFLREPFKDIFADQKITAYKDNYFYNFLWERFRRIFALFTRYKDRYKYKDRNSQFVQIVHFSELKYI
jgi:hypothetical protein